MQYYTFALDEESKDLTTIVMPFGKYRYKVLAMGLKCLPDFAQETMENIFRNIDDAEVYIDNIGAFSPNWEQEHHLQLLRTILTILQENGFTVNPLKCNWVVKETDWLRYWLTPTGLKPWKKKLDAVLKMEAPKTLKELRGCIGMVNYYCNMWPHQAHILTPLTLQTGAPKKGQTQQKYVWTEAMQAEFDQMKVLVAMVVLCAYPNHNKLFHIYTNASDYQLGSFIMQDGQPVAYWSKKLNNAQPNYSTVDKELLSIVMTIHEFWSMLLGAELQIHTNHKNILIIGDSSQRRLRWISYVHEYGPELHYVEGSANVVADTFLRLSWKDTLASPTMGKKQPAEHNINTMMSMRCLLITISHGLTTEKCLNALNVFLTKSATLIYQTIWLIPIPWTWKISKNNRTQMMPCCNMQLNLRTDIRVNASEQLMISYAT
jgi:hypothetical protein